MLKKREVQSTLDGFLTSPLVKRQRPATEEEETYCTLNKLRKFGRRIVKALCTYFQFNSIRRAQVKVGLINLCKGLFSLNALIYYKLKSGT